jgi:serine/threonine protein phosphatase PrpC
MPASHASHATVFSGAFASAARTHAGCLRTSNEDRFLVRGEVGLWAVADGMGGHEDGSIASGLVMDSLASVDFGSQGAADVRVIEASLQESNGALQVRARGGIMGTTIVALLANAREYVCLWAGDSRAYLRRDGKLTQITHDHSLVQRLVDEGRLSAGDARTHPRLNVITRAVGAAPDLTLERRRAASQTGDLFLLCSDGLSGIVGDSEINDLLAAAPLEVAADGLVELALRRGAPDNVTVVLVRRQ